MDYALANGLIVTDGYVWFGVSVYAPVLPSNEVSR